jgi:hypothetical protein
MWQQVWIWVSGFGLLLVTVFISLVMGPFI